MFNEVTNIQLQVKRERDIVEKYTTRRNGKQAAHLMHQASGVHFH